MREPEGTWASEQHDMERQDIGGLDEALKDDAEARTTAVVRRRLRRAGSTEELRERSETQQPQERKERHEVQLLRRALLDE